MIPLYQFVARSRSVDRRPELRGSLDLPALECRELVARPLALAAALAVSLLAVSGAGGARAQTPKRGGTIIVRSRRCGARLSQPVRASCRPTSPALTSRGPRGCIRGRPRLASGRTSSRDVDVHEKPPFTLTYHIRPEARWSDGVPITASDFVFTHERISQASLLRTTVYARDIGSVRSARREDGAGRAALAVRAAGATSSESSCRDTCSPARTWRPSGRTESTIRRRARRSEAVRSSSSAGSAAGR